MAGRTQYLGHQQGGQILDGKVRGVIDYRRYRRVDDDHEPRKDYGENYYKYYKPWQGANSSGTPMPSGKRPAPQPRPRTSLQSGNRPMNHSRGLPRDPPGSSSSPSRMVPAQRSPSIGNVHPGLITSHTKKPAPPPPRHLPRVNGVRFTGNSEIIPVVKMRKKRLAPPPPMQRWSENSEEYKPANDEHSQENRQNENVTSAVNKPQAAEDSHFKHDIVQSVNIELHQVTIPVYTSEEEEAAKSTPSPSVLPPLPDEIPTSPQLPTQIPPPPPSTSPPPDDPEWNQEEEELPSAPNTPPLQPTADQQSEEPQLSRNETCPETNTLDFVATDTLNTSNLESSVAETTDKDTVKPTDKLENSVQPTPAPRTPPLLKSVPSLCPPSPPILKTEGDPSSKAYEEDQPGPSLESLPPNIPIEAVATEPAPKKVLRTDEEPPTIPIVEAVSTEPAPKKVLRTDAETGEMRKTVSSLSQVPVLPNAPPAPPPPPPPPPPIGGLKAIPKRPIPQEPSPHKISGFRVMYPTPGPTIDINLKTELIQAAEERAKRAMSISEVVPDNRREYHLQFSQELEKAFKKREARKQCGTIHMRNVCKNYHGNSKIYKALSRFNDMDQEHRIEKKPWPAITNENFYMDNRPAVPPKGKKAGPSPNAMKEISGRPKLYLSMVQNVQSSSSRQDWTPADDLPASFFDEDTEQNQEITSRRSDYYEVFKPPDNKHHPSGITSPSGTANASETEKHFKKNPKSLSYSKSGGSVKRTKGSRNSAGVITRSISRENGISRENSHDQHKNSNGLHGGKSREKEHDEYKNRDGDHNGISSRHDEYKDSDGWHVYPACRFDTMPKGQVKVEKVEMAAAYAYNKEKGELCILPNFERVVVTGDGKRYREAAVTKRDSLPSVLPEGDVKSITGSVNNLTELVTGTLGSPDLKDKRRSTVSIESERHVQEFSEMQFEQVRYLNKKFKEEDEQGLKANEPLSPGCLVMNTPDLPSPAPGQGSLGPGTSWQSDIHPILHIPSSLNPPAAQSPKINGQLPNPISVDQNNNHKSGKKRRSLKSLFNLSKKSKEKSKKKPGILYDNKGNPVYNSDDEDSGSRGLDDSGYNSNVNTPVAPPCSLSGLFTPPGQGMPPKLDYGLSKAAIVNGMTKPNEHVRALPDGIAIQHGHDDPTVQNQHRESIPNGITMQTGQSRALLVHHGIGKEYDHVHVHMGPVTNQSHLSSEKPFSPVPVPTKKFPQVLVGNKDVVAV